MISSTAQTSVRIRYPTRSGKRRCSLVGQVSIRRCSYRSYKELSAFHYRAGNAPAVVADVFGAFFKRTDRRAGKSERLVGIIVYAWPALHLATRNKATRGRYLPGKNASAACRRLNREVKTIARVVVDPQFRGIGLAVRLVAETMPSVGALYVESLAAMGKVNPFFEKAGMTRWPSRVSGHGEKFIAALRCVGIGREIIPSTARLERAIADLPEGQRELVIKQMYTALDAYQRTWTSREIKHDWPKDLKRVSANMLNRPEYFIWRNPAWQQP
ncbi:MAG: hypothetical protein GWP14_09645 [Actinobacteria bacterium]|nr:hypothetical protein [Actinomycetota bacterium]